MKLRPLIPIFILLILSASVFAENILHIGDSHTAGPYGQELDKLFKGAGKEIHTIGCVGVSAAGFANGNKKCEASLGSTYDNIVKDYFTSSLPNLFSILNPEVIIISLGANYLEDPEQSKLLLDQLNGKPCYWVGPPHGPTVSEMVKFEFYQKLQEMMQGKCTLIDSRPYTDYNFCPSGYPCSANPHFNAYGMEGMTMAKTWAKAVFDQISSQGFTSQAPATRGQASVGPTPTVSPIIPTAASTCLSATCNEVDEVWSSISSIVGNAESKGKIWDGTRWVAQVTVPIPIATPGGTSSGALYEDSTVKINLAKGTYDTYFISKVNGVSTSLGINPLHLLAVMSFETGGTFNPAIRNKASSAVGLIQFLESTAVSLGTTTEKLAKMTQVEQLDYVKMYYQKNGEGIRNNNLGDVAMAVIWPTAIGKSEEYVLFTKGDGYYEPNAGLDLNNDNQVTRGEYLVRVKKQGYGLS